MPSITHGKATVNTSGTLHTLYQHARKNPNASYTPAGWARGVLAANRQATTPKAVKALGMQYRAQLWRASGNGVGRGNTYPPMLGSAVCAAIANAGTLQGAKLATAQAGLLAKARKAGAAASTGAKRVAKGRNVGAAKPPAPAPVATAPTAPPAGS